jgi:ABC-type transport system substrate-binding protein
VRCWSGFAPRDFDQIVKEGKIKVSGVPIPNALWYLALNTAKPPFDNAKLRQALAWAMPYEQIQNGAFFNRAVPMYGGPAEVSKAVWPQPFPYVTDIDKAKALMKEAGLEGGLETTLSLDTGTATVGEPTIVLIQENLAKIGVKTQINKIPGANWDHAEQEGIAAGAQPLQRLAGLSRVLFLLEFSRQQFDLQHLIVPEQGHGRADRQGALHRRSGRI